MRLIDANYLVKTIEKAQLEGLKVNVLSLINDAPTIEPSKVRDTQTGCVDGFKCSVCNVSRVFRSNYCPNCGSKMKGEEAAADEKEA